MIGDLSNFFEQIPQDKQFDFITLTNTIHEIEPEKLASILFHCIDRLSNSGILFIYDMESLPDLELGAVPWTKDEVTEILKALFESLKVETYSPGLGQWKHKTCNGWNVQIRKDYILSENEEVSELKDITISVVSDRIRVLLESKFQLCVSSLESMTKFGAETEEEKVQRSELLYNFWSLSRSLGVHIK